MAANGKGGGGTRRAGMAGAAPLPSMSRLGHAAPASATVRIFRTMRAQSALRAGPAAALVAVAHDGAQRPSENRSGFENPHRSSDSRPIRNAQKGGPLDRPSAGSALVPRREAWRIFTPTLASLRGTSPHPNEVPHEPREAPIAAIVSRPGAVPFATAISAVEGGDRANTVAFRNNMLPLGLAQAKPVGEPSNGPNSGRVTRRIGGTKTVVERRLIGGLCGSRILNSPPSPLDRHCRSADAPSPSPARLASSASGVAPMPAAMLTANVARRP